MRIQAEPAIDSPKFSKARAGSNPASLKPGDELRVKVLFSENGTVNLKTEDGNVIRARLDGDVNLPAGSSATVVVKEIKDGVTYMSVNHQGGGEEAAGLKEGAALGSIILEGDSLQMARQLDSMRLPVTEQSVASMKALLEANPAMNAEEAAFIASNNIPGEKALLEAAVRLISGEAKTAQMLSELAGTLAGTELKEDGAGKEGVRQILEGAYAQMAPETEKEAAGEKPPSWAEWLGKFVESEMRTFASGSSDARVQASSGQTGEPIMAGQSGETHPVEEAPPDYVISEKTKAEVLKAPEEMAGETKATRILEEEAPNTPRNARETEAPDNAQRPREEEVIQTRETPKETFQDVRVSPGENAVQSQHPAGQTEQGLQAGLARTLFSLLSQMPAFKETPDGRIEELTNLLVNTAGDFAAAGDGSEEPKVKLRQIIEGLFAKLDGFEGKEGEVLKRAVDELYVRLSLFSEALRHAAAGSGSDGKTAALKQTQRLLDHVRLLDSIDHFTCVHIPVEINGEHKNAELYIYKHKKGSKRIDPENVKILLALDMTHMGHLETFINIRGKDVSLEMEVEHEGVDALFRQNTVRLHNLLAEAGFKLADTKIRLSKDETTVGGALLTLFQHEKKVNSGIDFMI